MSRELHVEYDPQTVKYLLFVPLAGKGSWTKSDDPSPRVTSCSLKNSALNGFALRASIYIHVSRAFFSKNLRSALFFSVPHKMNPDEQTPARIFILGSP